jgi:hypothetical protein
MVRQRNDLANSMNLAAETYPDVGRAAEIDCRAHPL